MPSCQINVCHLILPRMKYFYKSQGIVGIIAYEVNEMITAKDNSRIKEIKKLQQRKYRKKQQRYLIEGYHLVEEAYQAGIALDEIFVTPTFLASAPAWLKKIPYTEVSLEVLKSFSELPTPQGIVAVAPMMQPTPPETLKGGYLLLDSVQDPGNVGTMIRTADAFGLAGVVVGEGSADLYQGKVLRALQGSQYHLPIYEGSLFPWLAKAHAQHLPIYGTELNPKAISLKEVVPTADYLVVLGNEGQGVSGAVLKEATQHVYIPMQGQAESLNVGVACGIALYHLAQ